MVFATKRQTVYGGRFAFFLTHGSSLLSILSLIYLFLMTLISFAWYWNCFKFKEENTRLISSSWFFKPFGGMLMAPWFGGRLNQSWFWARFLLCAGQQPHKLWTGLIISGDQLSIRTKQKQTKLDSDFQNKALHCCWTMSLFYKTPTSFITINVQIRSSYVMC